MGTEGEQGHGHGLMLAQDYLREMGGSLELVDREGGGLSGADHPEGRVATFQTPGWHRHAE